MIIVDERDPVGELPPPFPPRNVVVKDDDDVRKFYDLKREIGRGRFGTVYLVNDKETGQKFAAKFVSTKRNQDRGNVQREIEIMKALNAEKPHPRLIQLYDAFDMDKEMCLVLEIVDGGELFERVIDDDFVLTEKACTIFIRQICEGVEFIHSKNILHLDMKPENILCLSREGNRIKICDFGLARKYDPRKKLQVLFGTPEFVAPEVVNFEPISFGTDMWSVGVITYVLLSGLSPFMGHNYVETMTNVTKNKYDFEDEAFKSVSEDAKDFIRKLLVLDKSLRLTPAQCQRDSWLTRPPVNTLHRSMSDFVSDSEEELDEDDHEDISIEEKIIKEEIENEKKKKEDELERQSEARKKELEQQAEIRKKELERQAADAKKIEMEKLAEAKKMEEELELTKKQLKDFVERWNSHPNSPYLIGTPIPLNLQRVGRGWDSRDSFTSVVVGPPSDPGDISEPDDDFDIIGQDEFIRYTIEPQKTISKQLSPEEVAKELGEKLTLLEQEEISKNKENQEKDSELQKAEDELQNRTNTEKSTVMDTETKLNNNTEPESKKAPHETEKKPEAALSKPHEMDLPTKPSESKRKTGEVPKETKEARMEKHKRAYEERKKLKNFEEEKKKETPLANEVQEEQIISVKREDTDNISSSLESLRSNESHVQIEIKKDKIQNIENTRPPEERVRVRERPSKQKDTAKQDEKDTDNISSSLESLRPNESHVQDEIKKDKSQNIENIRPPEERVRVRERPSKQKDKAKEEEKDTAVETLKKITEKPMSDYKKEYEEYLKMVNDTQKKLDEPQVKDDQKKSSPTPKRSNIQKANETKLPARKLNGIEKSASLSVVKDLFKKEADKAEKTKGLKKPFSQRFRFGKDKSTESKSSKQNGQQIAEEKEPVNTKSKEVEIEEHKKLYQEYLKMVSETQNLVDVEPNKNEIENKTNTTNSKLLDHRLQNGKENKIESTRELQRRVSDSYKASDSQRKSSAKTIENLPKEPLKRPEIIALQNEELGGSVPRQRKISIPRYEVGGECLSTDRSSRGSTPGSPGMDGSHSPKFDRSDAFDHSSRGPTPTKQLKKQPSRDVPLQAKDDSPGTSVRQRPSRDVLLSYISLDKDDVCGADRQPSRDLTPEATSSLSRKTSHEERPSSRGTREGTPVNRRPSRDVPLTTNLLERFSSTSSIAGADQSVEPQAWPDLIVVPQGEDAEECSNFKDSLDVPIATLVKSPSGTLLSVPGVTISQHDKDRTATPVGESMDESDPAYVTNNKLVAWILDIGNTQNQRDLPFTTSDRVSQWESRDGSPRPTGRSSRDPSPRARDRSPHPSETHRDKSPIPSKQQHTPYPLSREPSTMSLKSSTSSDNLFIQTPWGAMKRSPSRTNLSESPSFEVPAITLKESQDAAQSTTEDLSQYSQSDDHMSVDSSTRSPSPKMLNNLLQKQDSLEISEIRDFQTCTRLSGELPPKPPEKAKTLYRSNRDENLNINDMSRQEDSKSHTLPRSSRLMKMNSVSGMNSVKSFANDRKVDNKKSLSSEKKANEIGNTDSLKRKSKFPPSPNQKKKLGPLLFSAQDRISQFEQTQTPSRTQRAITRTKSNMIFSKTTERLHPPHNLLENSLTFDENKNTKTSLLSSKSNDKTHVKFIANRLLDKVVNPTPVLPAEVIQNVDSLNNNVGNVRRNSAIFNRRYSSGMTKK